MSKPATEQPARPAPVSPEVERIIRERIADEGPSRPAEEVLADLEARRPLPR